MAKTLKKGSGRFTYQRRSPETWKEKARESSGSFDRFTIDGLDRFSARDGANRIRILPPTWPDADDWAYRLFIHYSVGADEQSYLCPKAMKDEPCAVCEEASRLMRDGDLDEARRLRAKKRAACWVIDRKDPGSGPKFWAMPFSVAQSANLAAEDEEGSILEFDHPQEGYDVLFTKEGSRDRTKYVGLKLARNPSPITDDEDDMEKWWEYIKEHPIPDILKFYSSDHIAAVFSGKSNNPEEDEDDDTGQRGKKVRARLKVVDEEEEDEDEEPRGRSSDEDEEEDESPKRRRKIIDEDEDEDERPAKRVAKSTRYDDDDDEEEEEDEDEDEDDRSVSKRLSASSKKPTTKKKRQLVEDEDDDE